MSEVEHVLATQDKLGEGPLWSVEEQALFWVNIMGQTFHRYYPDTGKHEEFNVGTEIGVLAERKSGGLIMATHKGFASWDWGTQALTVLVHPEAEKPGHRFNDGAVDAKGRFWAGTMDDHERNLEGVLYRLDPDLSVHVMGTGFGTANGIGWSPDNKIMYHIDSRFKEVYAYDFDLESGSIANRRVLVHFESGEGSPDGLTMDSAGYLWVAHWGGWRVTRFDPTGKVDQVVEVPVECPTKPALGGVNLDEMYITSAWKALDEEQRKSQPLAGDLFRVKVSVPGVPAFKFAG